MSLVDDVIHLPWGTGGRRVLAASFAGTATCLILISTFAMLFAISGTEASYNTIYIRQDGAIDPPEAPIERIGTTYRMSSNASATIIIEKNDVVVDANDFTIEGTAATGLLLSRVSNVTIKNFHIKGFLIGISLDLSSNCSLLNNEIRNNGFCSMEFQDSTGNSVFSCNLTNSRFGIYLLRSKYNVVSECVSTNCTEAAFYLDSSVDNAIGHSLAYHCGTAIFVCNSTDISIANNEAENNLEHGIYVENSIRTALSDNVILDNGEYGICSNCSADCVFSRNIMSGNKYNFGILGQSRSDFENAVEPSNLVDGKRVYYLIDVSNVNLDSNSNAGTVYVIDSSNVTLRNLTFSKNAYGIFMWNTSSSTIENVSSSANYYGISLLDCNRMEEADYTYFNNVWDNTVTGNCYGIHLSSSNFTSIAENLVTDNTYDGIRLVACQDGGINDNVVTHNENGIVLENTSSFVVVGQWVGEPGNIVANNSNHGISMVCSNNNQIMWDNVIANNSRNGIALFSSNSNMISQNNITNNYGGVRIDNSTGNVVASNTVTNSTNWYGIFLNESPNSTVRGNRVTDNERGIGLMTCPGSDLSRNVMLRNRYNFGLGYNFEVDIDSSNLVNGKQICLMKNVSNVILDESSNAATVYIIDSTNVTVKNLDLSENLYGVYLQNSRNLRIETITGNRNYWGGVYMEGCEDCTISRCNLENNTWDGLSMRSCASAVVSENIVKGNGIWGIHIYLSSSRNKICDNCIVNNAHGGSRSAGLCLDGSDNAVFGNNIIDNEVHGIFVVEAGNNKLFHNNIRNNDVVDDRGPNNWDNGAEGNFWGSYDGLDLNQDGIGDSPHFINDYSKDRFPLMEPWIQPKVVNMTVLGKDFGISAIANSTVAGFDFNQTERQFSFKATGPNGTYGYCNITVPKELLDSRNGSWIVTVNGELTSFDMMANSTHTTISLIYAHSTNVISMKGDDPIDIISPVVNAGANQTIYEEESVTFDGSASKDNIANASELTYVWAFTDQTPQMLNGTNPTYTFRSSGEYLVELNVTDLRGNWNIGIVRITVISLPIWLRWWFWTIVLLIPVTSGVSYLAFSYVTRRSGRTYDKLMKLARRWVHEEISEEEFNAKTALLKQNADERTRSLVDQYLKGVVAFARAEKAAEEQKAAGEH